MPKRDPFRSLEMAIQKYLHTVGWEVLVVRNPRIQKELGLKEFDYEFVVGITAVKRNTNKETK